MQITSPRKEKRRQKSMKGEIRNSCRLGRRPEKQGPRPQSRDQGWVEKFDTGIRSINKPVEESSKLRLAAQQIVIGTWNVQTLWSCGKLELLRREMAKYKYDILGISEMRWTGCGELNSGEVIWSGEEKEHQRGVGFLLNKRARDALIGYIPVSSRIIAATFKGTPMNITVIQVYAPTADKTDEEIEQFYEQLEGTIRLFSRKDVKIIVGDWNAKVGSDREGWESVMGRYGFGERNERGKRLLEFAEKHGLMICNTRFQQKECRKWTWRAPDGKHKNMIDLVLVDRRWKTSVKNCRTYQGADISSDHSLVLCKLRLKLKCGQKRNHVAKRDIKQLERIETQVQYKKEIEDALKSQTGNEDLNQQVAYLNRAIINAFEKTVPKVNKTKKPWISQQTLQLVEEKRLLKQRRELSQEAGEKYKQKCNEVRKAARKDKQEWINNQCRDIDSNLGIKPRQAFQIVKRLRGEWRSKLRVIKGKDGRALHTKEEIKARWTEYCEELFNGKIDCKDRVKQLEDISPPSEEDRDNDSKILYEEVLRAVKKMKNHKSPGADGITAEMIKAGGEKLTKEIHRVCNQIWNSEVMPEEWTRSVIVTIPKKGDLQECTNYRTIALASHTGKIMMNILLERFQAQIDCHLSEAQAGFRKDRSTVQQILILRLIAEKAKRKNVKVYNCFIDFQKAFDSIWPDVLWATMRSYGVMGKLIRLLKNAYAQAQSAVRIDNELGEWFTTTVGTKQGDPISPSEFTVYLERIMDIIQQQNSGILISGEQINNLRFADDIDLLEEELDTLQSNAESLKEMAELSGLKINISKTKTMVFGRPNIEKNLIINNTEVENVEEFTYLGSVITWDNDCSVEINRRIDKARSAMASLKDIWKNKQINLQTKLKLLRTCVFSVLLYASETWTLKRADKDRLKAFEMKCYRWILHIRWQQMITNKEVSERMGVIRTVVQQVIERKLSLFGHICRMKDSRLIKTVMFGRMNGLNRRGRPCREWLDDVTDWCRESVHVLSHKAQDRQKWRELVRQAVDTYGHSAQGP